MDRVKNELALKEIMLRIGGRIKQERENRGWDYMDVIIRSGVSQSAIYNLELGISDNVTIKSVVALAHAFDMDVFMLISLSE